MTRASLLHILDHVSAISETEIRELEQLAAAFPYCQTAHVLLAKAAHDQGSMLAGQRLRRAATYATDRQLLRQLIEQPAFSTTEQFAAPAPVAPGDETPALGPEATFVAVAPAEPAEEEVAAPEAAAAEVAPAPAAADSVSLVASEEIPTPEQIEVAEPSEAPIQEELPTAEQQPEALEETALERTPEASTEVLAPAAAPEATILAAIPEQEAEASAAEQEPAENTPGPEAVTDAASSSELLEPDTANTPIDQAVIADELLPEDSSVPAENLEPVAATFPAAEPVAEPADEDILPPVAPPIRPPAEAGSSRFEFGLGLPDPAHGAVYELPVPQEDEAPTAAAETAAAGFRGDDFLAYALSGGSRLGFCLQAADELTIALPGTTFFAPDALLHAQPPRYQPAPPPAPSSFDLINKFLRNKPRLRTPAARPAAGEEQTDLSVRSTQGVPDLASESLAQIMVRQGKLHKAIEIYERLMVRQPEKKAYFADQIQQLKSTE
ncbi:hypothetical protein E5K00_02890 [Hymenobacter aquaticus]|uniref:Tetratricopeptide repeat protein n=1 Tax=Hymenobacter aquaticus TaxID=1867101 RepID=A0A4Z0Q3W4_9BACT|nr:hypothetical protein [Hymenobacter aquaticus]TGE24176.1 hypothetical protein E5K00_02890 [Hymenobacter aquaticus]